jgi:hypothetical protein
LGQNRLEVFTNRQGDGPPSQHLTIYQPSVFCPPNLPQSLRYDPATGFARRPVDNIGVQYGLAALNVGVIDATQRSGRRLCP